MTARRTQSEYRLSVQELEQREDEQLRLADIVIRRSYARKVKQALERLKFNKHGAKLAEELLNGDKRVEDIIDREDPGQWGKVISNACKEYQGLRDITFLLINAPRKHTCLSIEQDREAREKQMLNFYNVITYNRDKNKCIKVMTTVHTYKILLQHLEAFMQEDASLSKRTYIVFNGHGKNTGHLSLEDEVDSISNSLFIDDIHNTWKMCKQRLEEAGDKVILPERISVILAHCYGYKHQVRADATEVIDVVCLTNAHNPETRFVYKMNTSGQKVTDALHIELTNYARDVIKQESLESETSEASDDGHRSRRESQDSQVCSEPVTNATSDKTESSEARSSSVLPPLDVTTLACLSFSSDIEQPFVLQPTSSDTSRSRPLSVLPGIETLEFNVSPKRLSDYFITAKSSVGCVEKMMWLTASLPMAIGSHDNELVESVQERGEVGSHSTAKALKSSLDLLTASLAPVSDLSNLELNDTRHVRHKHTTEKMPEKKKKKAPKLSKTKNSKFDTGVSALSALVGVTMPLCQLAQSVDIPEKSTKEDDCDC